MKNNWNYMRIVAIDEKKGVDLNYSVICKKKTWKPIKYTHKRWIRFKIISNVLANLNKYAHLQFPKIFIYLFNLFDGSQKFLLSLKKLTSGKGHTVCMIQRKYSVSKIHVNRMMKWKRSYNDGKSDWEEQSSRDETMQPN